MKASKLNKSGLNRLERRSISALAAVYGLRMYGLFLILPVLAIYSQELGNVSPMMMGVALGVYGITQAIFQLPFGIMSDKFGRKPIILGGLSLFIIGSLVAAISSSIEGVILGRALQGAGAIAAAVLALTSDLTRENQRTKAMAFIGMSIGFAFLLALISAPVLSSLIGVRGLFVMTAILAACSMVLIVKVVPTPLKSRNLEVRAVPSRMLALLKNAQLIRLDMGIFILHFVLTAMFVVVPIMMLESGLDTSQHWRVYIPALLGSIVFMVPMVILSSRKHLLVKVFMAAVCILLFAQILLMRNPSTALALTLCLFFFFWGFNLLEAMLPSMVSRLAPAASKGSAMGVYNTFQFLGVFLGGFIGGLVYGAFGVSYVFVVCAIALVFWCYLIYSTPAFKLLDSLVVTIKSDTDSDYKATLEAIRGVEEVIIIDGELTAYLKVDNESLDQEALSTLIID